VKGARREEKEPNILFKEQYKALLYEASDNIRDYAIIQTFLQTGIRLSELVNLRVEDVDLEHRILTVRQGKGKKDRQIPLVDDVLKALRNYLRYRTTELILDDDTFFLAKNGTSMNVSTVKYLVAGAKFGRATTTLVESQRVKTPMMVSWISHACSLLQTLRHQFTDT
jgi:integrase/recombinase XerD